MFSVRVGFQPGGWDNPAGPARQPPAGRTFLRRNRLRNGLKSLGATVKRGNSGASVSAGPPHSTALPWPDFDASHRAAAQCSLHLPLGRSGALPARQPTGKDCPLPATSCHSGRNSHFPVLIGPMIITVGVVT